MKTNSIRVGNIENQERNFDRGAVLTLAIALILIVLSATQLIYRLTLPTDGWAVISTDDIDNSSWVYWENLANYSSALVRGDQIQSVEDQNLTGTASLSFIEPPSNWAIGKQVQVKVIRDGKPYTVSVPVGHWTWASWWRYNVLVPSQLASLLGGIVLFGIGLFTFWRRPGVPSARVLLILCATIFAAAISTTLPDGLSVQFNGLAFISTAFFSYAIFGTLLAPSLLTFSLLFPKPKQIIRKRPLLAFVPYCLGLLLLIGLIANAPASTGWVMAMLMIIITIISFVHSGFTQRDAVSRAQLRWAIGGFVLGLGLVLMVYPSAFGWITDPFWAELLGSGFNLGIVVIGITLSIAILKYRLYDIDLIINKTLVYSLLTMILALVYFGSVVLFEQLTRFFSGESSSASVVVSTLVIAALFAPLRRRLQTSIDRRFYRKKYNAAQVLAAFSLRARDEVDLEALTAEILHVVQETVQPSSVTIALKTDIRGAKGQQPTPGC